MPKICPRYTWDMNEIILTMLVMSHHHCQIFIKSSSNLWHQTSLIQEVANMDPRDASASKKTISDRVAAPYKLFTYMARLFELLTLLTLLCLHCIHCLHCLHCSHSGIDAYPYMHCYRVECFKNIAHIGSGSFMELGQVDLEHLRC